MVLGAGDRRSGRTIFSRRPVRAALMSECGISCRAYTEVVPIPSFRYGRILRISPPTQATTVLALLHLPFSQFLQSRAETLPFLTRGLL